jgi:hypothetical protein
MGADKENNDMPERDETEPNERSRCSLARTDDGRDRGEGKERCAVANKERADMANTEARHALNALP